MSRDRTCVCDVKNVKASVTQSGLSSRDAGGRTPQSSVRTVMQNRVLNVAPVSFLYHRLLGFEAPYL